MIGRPKIAAPLVILKCDSETRRTGAAKSVEKPKSVQSQHQLRDTITIKILRSQFVIYWVIDVGENNTTARLERQHPISPFPWAGLLDDQLFVSVANYRHQRQPGESAERMPDRIKRFDDSAILLQNGDFVLSVEFLYFNWLSLDRDNIPCIGKTFAFGVGELRSSLIRGGGRSRFGLCRGLGS